jgi:hypothetical protein
MSPPFDPSALGHDDLARRLRIVSPSALPSSWPAGRLPRPALPIDECVQVLLKKRRIRPTAELQAIHPLGVCPYAIARYGIAVAASYARQEKNKEIFKKRSVIPALKALKDERRRLCISLNYALALVQPLLDASGQLQLSAVHPDDLANAIVTLRNRLGEADIQSDLRELSKFRGNVWRLTFVASLFAEWWVLTGKDPKPSAGPCQEFICAAWCTLSSLAAETDADWASAIKVALSRCGPGAWRNARRLT